MSYLGKTPSQAVRQRYIFTASGGETSISGADDNGNTLTYTDGAYADVYLNGVLLVAGTDYNTSTANTIGGLTALSASDVVEIVVYDTFAVFGGEVQGDFSVSNGGFTATQDSTNPVTINRTTSDGTIIDLQKNGTTVGSIGTASNDLYIGDDSVNLRFRGGSDNIIPATSGGGIRDNAIDLGQSTSRFKDLYLSGGVFLGGTGAANYLDDYEEGTWTPVLTGSTSGTVNGSGVYTKVGDLVHFACNFSFGTGTKPIGNYTITALPFTAKTGTPDSAQVNFNPTRMTFDSSRFLVAVINDGTSYIGLYEGRSNNTAIAITDANWVNGNTMFLRMNGTYITQ